jgi:hypothetical protein
LDARPVFTKRQFGASSAPQRRQVNYIRATLDFEVSARAEDDARVAEHIGDSNEAVPAAFAQGWLNHVRDHAHQQRKFLRLRRDRLQMRPIPCRGPASVRSREKESDMLNSTKISSTGTAPRQTHWRRLPRSELADRILQLQRTAAHRHLSVQEWRRLDRMRRRHAALQKELMS